MLITTAFKRPKSSHCNYNKILPPYYGPLDLTPELSQRPHRPPHAVSPFNTHSISFCFLNMPNSFRSQDLCPCYSWCLEGDFLPPNDLELNSTIPSLKTFPPVILAKVLASSTLFTTCTYFLHSIYAYLKLCICWGQPNGTLVKFSSPGFAGSDPRFGPTHSLPSHAVAGVPHIKYRKMGTDVSSGPIFLSKKRGGLVVDVSSGLIYLKEKKIERKESAWPVVTTQ